MIDERTTELIHLVLDGEADARGAAELGAARDQFPEVESLYRELEELAASLGSSLAEPPPGLAERVIATLESQREPAAAGFAAGGGSGAALVPFAPRRRAVFALAAAAGIILVLTAVPLIESRFPVDGKSVTGSMKPLDVGSWPEIARAGTADTGVELVVRRRGDQIAVIPSTGSGASGPVRIRWDDEMLNSVDVLPEVRNDAPYADKGEAVFIPGESSPGFILRPLPGAAGRTEIDMYLGAQKVASVEITLK